MTTAVVQGRCDWGRRCGEAALARALAALAQPTGRAVSLAYLDSLEVQRLHRAAARLAYRPARPNIGTGDKAVHQDFELTTAIPEGGVFHDFAASLERRLRIAGASLTADPLPAGFRLNDLIAQRYQAGSRGITAHRDHLRYRGVIALLTLSGQARFALCRSRSADEIEPLNNAPGRLLLLRAPGFAGADLRPFHLLDRVTRQRYSFGLRWDSWADRRSET